MNQNMTTILDKIKEYNKIILFRHFRPDGDATGSTKGLQRIIQLTYPEKTVLLINNDYADLVLCHLPKKVLITLPTASLRRENPMNVGTSR